MPNITITISDAPGGRGAIVRTDGEPPAIGRTLTPAQALAMDLLRTCKSQALEVQYGADKVPLVDLANALLTPERLGYTANPEIRDAARVALGGRAVEFVPAMQARQA